MSERPSCALLACHGAAFTCTTWSRVQVLTRMAAHQAPGCRSFKDKETARTPRRFFAVALRVLRLGWPPCSGPAPRSSFVHNISNENSQKKTLQQGCFILYFACSRRAARCVRSPCSRARARTAASGAASAYVLRAAPPSQLIAARDRKYIIYSTIHNT